MEKRNFYFLSSDDKTKIHGIEWIPDGEIHAVLQICHGMVEYIDRYDAFAQFLTGEGFYVTGHDHLGHGESVQHDEDHGYFGQPDGNKCVIGDIDRLRKMTTEKHPGLPYFMLGHSMGSFLLRQYLTVYGDGLSGAIIMGTGTQPQAILVAARLLCRIIALFKGWRYRSSLIDNMAFGGYNKKFEPSRTKSDWLTKDEAIVDAYCRHPWCTFKFTVNAYFNMFYGISIAQKDAGMIPKTLPMLVVSGADDPVGGFGNGVKQVYEGYRRMGINDVTLRLYENDRHEILNETDRATVFHDILTWLNNHIY